MGDVNPTDGVLSGEEIITALQADNPLLKNMFRWNQTGDLNFRIRIAEYLTGRREGDSPELVRADLQRMAEQMRLNAHNPHMGMDEALRAGLQSLTRIDMPPAEQMNDFCLNILSYQDLRDMGWLGNSEVPMQPIQYTPASDTEIEDLMGDADHSGTVDAQEIFLSLNRDQRDNERHEGIALNQLMQVFSPELMDYLTKDDAGRQAAAPQLRRDIQQAITDSISEAHARAERGEPLRVTDQLLRPIQNIVVPEDITRLALSVAVSLTNGQPPEPPAVTPRNSLQPGQTI